VRQTQRGDDEGVDADPHYKSLNDVQAGKWTVKVQRDGKALGSHELTVE